MKCDLTLEKIRMLFQILSVFAVRLARWRFVESTSPLVHFCTAVRFWSDGDFFCRKDMRAPIKTENVVSASKTSHPIQLADADARNIMTSLLDVDTQVVGH
jgi:hypothetical protein